MKDEENIFEDLEDELVSSDSPVIEEQPTMGVPSNSNRGKIVARRKYSDELSEIKNKQFKNENIINNNINNNNNKETINKLNEVKNKNQGINNIAGNAGKEIGNKIAGKSEEEKSDLEKKTDDVGGKVASTAITAATGGAVSGPLADAVGNAAYQVLKKEQERRKKKIKIIVGVSVGILLFLIFIIIFFNEDDESDTSVVTNQYVTGDMSKDELVDYMSYIGICPDTEAIKKEIGEFEDIFAAINEYEKSTQTCKNAIEYYTALKEEYIQNKKACYRERNEHKEVLGDFWKTKDGGEAIYDNNPKVIWYFKGSHLKDDPDCQLKLPTQLYMESMSYDLDDQELFNPDYRDLFVSYTEDFRHLANATSEFVHEYCFKWEYTIDGVNDGTNCDPKEAAKKGYVCKKAKMRYDGYYFQASFNKYICYLKYGDTCNHPNYSGKPIVKGNPKNYYEIECSGPGNDHLSNKADELSTSSGNVCTDKCKQEAAEGTDTFTQCYQQCVKEKDKTDVSSDKEGQTYKIEEGTNTVVDYALQFIGNPYVWGGESLTNGADCSGFVKSVFANFGISLPHSAHAMASVGVEVSEPQPGDLITYKMNSEGTYHVAIYIGDGKIVHAASKKSGIKVSNDYTYRDIDSIRRVIS